jgi:AP-1 complex subunit mu
MISGLYILDLKGKILISRQYRGDIAPHIPEKFILLLQDAQEKASAFASVPTTSNSNYLDPAFCPPILSHSGYHYLYIRHADIYCKFYSITSFIISI